MYLVTRLVVWKNFLIGLLARVGWNDTVLWSEDDTSLSSFMVFSLLCTYYPDTPLTMNPADAEMGYSGRPMLNQVSRATNHNISGVALVIVVLYTFAVWWKPLSFNYYKLLASFSLCRERWTERVTDRSFSPLFPSLPASSVVWVYLALP